MEPEELANAILALSAWAQQHSTQPEPELQRRLRELFGRDPAELPVVSQTLQPWDRPNLQLAVDAWLDGRAVDLFGLPPAHGYRAGLAELVRSGGPEWMGVGDLSGVEHISVPLGEHESV